MDLTLFTFHFSKNNFFRKFIDFHIFQKLVQKSFQTKYQFFKSLQLFKSLFTDYVSHKTYYQSRCFSHEKIITKVTRQLIKIANNSHLECISPNDKAYLKYFAI